MTHRATETNIAPAPPVTVEVLLFAGAAAAAGCRRLTQAVAPGTTVRALASLLTKRFPGLEPYAAVGLWAVNEEYAPPETVLRPGDRVALIPPVSGGSGDSEEAAPPPRGATCRVTAEPLSVDAAVSAVLHPGAGAVVVFLGTVRAVTGDRRTAAIDYEAYEAMAEREMNRIAREATGRWPLVRLHMAHRTGRLEVGEVSVVVAASAPHRPDAFAACRWAIDRIKETVPIWKREIAPDGSGTWIHQC